MFFNGIRFFYARLDENNGILKESRNWLLFNLPVIKNTILITDQ